MKQKLLRDKETKKAYDDLEPEYALVRLMIEKRLQRKLTQAALAKKIGTKQSAISRFESGTYNPTIGFLRKMSDALGAELKISVSS
ncbi:MAG: Helix-turn-helix domain protein [Candidatus Uhrbacteria bacterium GW2011_GWA2_53_10]|uniref:Helix-turn-helix domain protein n=1 Tax=Candidatus Uhrbacteria bacterium GW2011_GWA2_53_10 TaxID=1618980 RepID=A0A0G1XPP2_9BACT|nr:MAG: Helix-turn-helix domain protein [Candidatus Uhrbacteria bacterium GW2011_GWA2_53_10]